jgi:hypothetical protein
VGLSFAGQTFDGSPDGSPQGVHSVEEVSPGTDGLSYTFLLAPTTAALLTIPGLAWT